MRRESPVVRARAEGRWSADAQSVMRDAQMRLEQESRDGGRTEDYVCICGFAL